MKGFTLFEALVVIAAILFLAALIFPLSLNFYKDQQLQTYSQGILQTLRRAQLKSMSIEADSTFGVYFDNTNKKYTLFKGNFYNETGRDTQYDEVFELPQIITVSGLSEVVFTKLEGKPSSSGSIILTSNSQGQTIIINEVGRINLE